MEITIKQATKLSSEILAIFGYSVEEASVITDILVDADISGKASHGLVRLLRMKTMIEDGRVEVSNREIEIVKETSQSILVSGKKKTGFYVVPKALDLAMEKMRKNKASIFCCGVCNTSPAAGMIGYYARKAVKKDLIYIGFHNSVRALIPFGAKKSLFGTNPITIGIPSTNLPVIWDCSTTKINVGTILVKKAQGEKLPEGVALDKEGNPTVDPCVAFEGGFAHLLPIAGHKGSGMAMMVELLAGALVGSSIHEDKQWLWGSFGILIDPTMFGNINDFKENVDQTITDLKALPKANGFDEIYYPGEKSQKLRQANIEKGSFELSETIYNDLNQLVAT